MESNIGLLNYWEKTGMITDKRLLDAFEKTRREDFILKEYENEAYGDYPLPIGHEQTISQPTTVMLMLKFLEAKPNHKVLEIGAGSGYNAAILSRLCKKVYCVERIKELADFAKSNLKKAKIENVEVIHADGSKGYKEKAPYDKIMITAAVPQIPQPLIDQLITGGVILAPVGNIYSQEMTWLKKTETGYKIREHGSFRFVKLIGKHGFKRA